MNIIGIVCLENKTINITNYEFVSDNTIKCVSEFGNIFWTHYKSLILTD